MGQDLAKRHAAEQALLPGQRGRVVQLRAPGFHDPSEVHTARTDAFAIAAHQAQLQVLAIGVGGLDAPLVERLNQVNAAAR